MIRTTAGSARAITPRRLLAAVMLAVGTAMPLSAQITFNGLGPLDDSGIREVGNGYIEGGLRFTVVGEPLGFQPGGVPQALATYTADNIAYTGSPALFNNLGFAIDISSVSGASFSVSSIGLAQIFPGAAGALPVAFLGTRLLGGTVSANLDVPALGLTPALTPFTLTNFTGLSSLRITPGAPDFSVQLDNVNASVVPEPSTYLLMVVGLGGIAFIARRRPRGA